MVNKATYICLDTNVYVFCALATKDAMNPGLLSKLFGDMDSLGVRLLIPEVVQLELPKVIERERESLRVALNSVKDEIDKNEALGPDAKIELKKAVDKLKKRQKRIIEKITKELKCRMINADKSAVVRLSEGDIVNEAIRIAIRGARPSKPSSSCGLLQPDCLIVASLRHFQDANPGCRIAFCTDNTRDFAMSDGNDGFALHPDIQEILGDVEFCTRPTQLYDGVLADDSADEKEIETLGNAFDAARRRSDAVESAVRALRFMEEARYSKLVRAIAEASQSYSLFDDASKSLTDSEAFSGSLTKAAQSSLLRNYEAMQKNVEEAIHLTALRNAAVHADSTMWQNARYLDSGDSPEALKPKEKTDMSEGRESDSDE